jgi:hypothetical protein
MNRPDFRSYIGSQPAKSEDAESRKQKWLAALGTLLTQVEAWLREYEDIGVTCTRVNRWLAEEGLGHYQATAMRITFGGREVWLEPIGTYIVGACGRVDLNGSADSQQFLFVPQEADRPRVAFVPIAGDRPGTHLWDQFVWKLATKPPKVRYEALSQEVFEKALIKVSDEEAV